MVLAFMEFTACKERDNGTTRWQGLGLGSTEFYRTPRERTGRKILLREVTPMLRLKRRGEINQADWESDLGRGPRTWHTQWTGSSSGRMNEQGQGGVETDETGGPSGPHLAESQSEGHRIESTLLTWGTWYPSEAARRQSLHCQQHEGQFDFEIYNLVGDL